MSDLKQIKGLDSATLELLEAVGIDDLEGLAESSLLELHRELTQANEELSLAKNTPTRKTVENWLKESRELTGIVPDQEEQQKETTPKKTEKGPPERQSKERSRQKALNENPLIDLPQAKALPGKALLKAGLKVSDIPVAEVIPEEKLKKILTQQYAIKQQELLGDSKYVASLLNKQKVEKRLEEGEASGIDFSKVQSIVEVNEGAERRVQPLERKEANKMTSVSQDLNKGVNPHSRRFVRGVLHFMPERIVGGALLALLAPVVILAGLISIILSVTPLIAEEYKLYAVGGFILSPFLGVVIFMFAAQGKCQVCGQSQFVPKQTRKNREAHHIPGLGHIIPTALHVLLFKWFRCIYCATSIRVKE